jgi:AraC-like DNA-binding protein
MPKKEPLFTFRLTGIVLDLLGLSAKDAGAFLSSVGLPETAATEACTVPLSRVRAFVDEAARRKHDPILGLHLSASVPEGTYEAAELLVRTAPTVGTGLAALAKHASLVNPIGQFRYDETRTHAELHYLVPGQRDGLGVHMNEYTVAYVLRGIRLVASGDVPLAAVWFAHERKSGAAEVEAFFGCKVTFGAASSGFSFTAETAARALGSGDKVVFAYLSKQAEKSRSELGPAPFSMSVQRAIEGEVGFAKATLSTVAKHLGVTARTAQRRLREEGTQFRDVLDQGRKGRFEELSKKQVPDLQVAELLGFADVGTFRRATKRWRKG